MTDTSPRLFDFHEIAALDDAAIAFRNWVAKSSSFFSDFWSEASDYAAQLKLGNVSISSYGKAIESLPRETNYSLVDFTDYAPSMWYASNSDLRRIAWAMLGLDAAVETTEKNTNDKENADKEASVADKNDNESKPTADDALSPVEQSLAQLFMEQLAIALNDGWMGGEPINLQTGTLAFDPRKARFFREKDLMTVTSIQIELKAGPVGINWLLSKQKTCDLLESAIDQRDDGAAPTEPQRPSAHLIGQLPIDVVSILGNATLPMSQISQLKVGQLIELDQRIDQPVIAVVNEVPFYEGWPGRRGKNQAIEVTRCLHQ